MASENKVEIVAPIQVETEVASAAKEKASVLAFPEERQGDLQYIRSVLVSAGTNKNGAHFLPSEMMKAHNTIVHKAIDLEHTEDKVIGHMYDCAFIFKDGEVFDPQKLMAEYQTSARDPDEVDIDIMVAGIIHKARFPEIAEEVNSGQWKVSMECFFRDFDIKVGSQILTRNEAQALGYNPEDLIGGFVKVVAGTKALGKHLVARVLRDITFSGMGLVKNPANPQSIIMETASHRQMLQDKGVVIDLESVDNLRGHRVEVRSETAAKVNETVDTSPNPTDHLVEIQPTSDDDPSLKAQEKFFVELDHETGGIKRVISVGGTEEAAIRYSGPGIGGPGSILSYPDEMCKSFKKRVTKFNALDQSEAVVVHEHWCALFEEPCPVIGASAKAPECLRNQRNRTTRDDADNTLTKTVREHLETTPGNTYTTVLTRPPVVETAFMQERKQKIDSLRSEAENFLHTLREYVAAQKKTSQS